MAKKLPRERRLLPGIKLRKNKLVQHARDYGVGEKGATPAHAAELIGKLVQHIYKNRRVVKGGKWDGTYPNALFYSNGNQVIVTEADGTLITILKNGKSNKKFLKAEILWEK